MAAAGTVKCAQAAAELSGPGTDSPPDKDTYQGPHNWRKRLKPVVSPSQENEPGKEDLQESPVDSPVERVPKDRRLSKEDRMEDSKIRERLKAMPAWKKDLVEKKTKGPVVAKALGTMSSSSSSNVSSGNVSPRPTHRRRNSGSHLESAFTRQVVNKPTSPGVIRRKQPAHPVHPSRLALPAWEKRLSYSNSLVATGRRTPSPNAIDATACSAEAVKKRVEKVMKARLYLLTQMGPNSFLIGGDSPDHKYRVIIGPQRCSCGRSPHCVHILFVMLRVFQISENDPCLWSSALKNYEVEALFHNFHARRTSLIENLRKKKVAKPATVPEEESNMNKPCAQNPEPEESEHADEEEDSCPICLLEMVEGESLTECVDGCQNKFHHHCIAIWFEECRRQNDPLICPLCRTQWKVETESSDAPSGEELPAPPNTRASSPQNVPQEADLMVPHAEPIPPEHMDTAGPWIPVLGEELASCMFSKNWMVREIALKQLGRIAIGALLLGVGEGRSGVLLSPSRQATTHSMLECCLGILAFMCADPVYKVFVAGLRTLRTVLAYTPCRDEVQQARLQALMRPVVDTILWKCADSNKRTSQLSISALEELVRGQEGELAIGKEIVNPGELDLGGVPYLVQCITKEYDPATAQWQWLLGRFYMLLRLLEDYPREFIMRPPSNAGDNCNIEDFIHHDRIMAVLQFTRHALDNTHQKVGRMARRAFYLTARLQAHNTAVLKKITETLEGLEINLQVHLKRNLLKVAAEFQVAQQVVGMMQQQAAEQASSAVHYDDTEPIPPFTTPIMSEASTPRSTSPAPTQQITVTVNNFVTGNLNFVPMVPPNSPEGRHKSTSGSCDSDLTCKVEGPHIIPSTEDWNKTLVASETICCVRSEAEVELADPPSKKSDEPGTTYIEIRTEEEEGAPKEADDVLIERNPLICETCGAPHDYKATSKVDACVCTSPSLRVRGLQLEPISEQDHDEEEDTPVTIKERPFSFVSDGSYEVLSQDECQDSRPCSPVGGAIISSTDATAASSSASNLTQELSDLTMSPSGGEGNVSFRTEVATASPQHTAQRSLRNQMSSEDECHCKEEVEKEEAQALVAAMEQSYIQQSTLPFVPGLSRTDDQETLTIHIQEEQGDNSDTSYLESEHWVRGPMLGTGAFSTCYQARDVKTGTLMAVKQISFCRNLLSEQEKVIEAVSEEIQMMSRLNHPNIVRILGATRQGCHFFMFVEWMSGGSVAYLLDRYGAFTESVIISYTQQVLMGLSYLHENHLLHRDLKGANLLVDSTGQRVRIGDFGAAARLASRTTMTGEFQGQLLGTIAFMAPEVLRGESYGRSCDVWSIGCIMIEMMTRKPPWGASDLSNHLALIFKIASAVEPPPIPDNLSPALRDLLLRCLECKREDRPPARDLLKHPLFTMYSKR